MKYIRSANKLILITLFSAFLSFVTSSLWEVLTLMLIFRKFDLHEIDATAYQPYLYSMFFVYFLVFLFFFLTNKKTPLKASISSKL